MKRIVISVLLCGAFLVPAKAQDDILNTAGELLDMFFQYLGAAQIDEIPIDSNRLDSVQWQSTPVGGMKLLKQKNLGDWNIKAGDYSGIVWLGERNFAVVSDKERTDGYIPFLIDINLDNGNLENVYRFDKVQGNPHPRYGLGGQNTMRDCEGIAYFPSNNSFFIAGEGDQRILEYDAYGKPTGRELAVPKQFGIDCIYKNYGFESLTYSPENHRFWTTTESVLKADGEPAGFKNPNSLNVLRIQSFGDDLKPKEQYAYRMDKCTVKKQNDTYAYGVSELLALPDGRLLVLEREFYVAERYAGSYVNHRLYVVDPKRSHQISFATSLKNLTENQFMEKKLVTEFKTELKIGKMNLANYEGMCLGPKLNDGRQTVILISDSQHNYGNSFFHLKDYMRVLIIG